MSLLEYAWNWNATDDECRAAYPCDEYIRGPHSVFMRAIDIEALSSVVYRWVCQVKVAPHSYARQLDVNGHHRPTWSQTTPARPIKARGFGLQDGCRRPFRGVSRRARRTRSPCRSLVDRSGFEPLTSAVQGRRSPS
jgi:hypothetical protein